jgi:hypothetical protein
VSQQRRGTFEKHILWGKDVKRRRVESAQIFGGSVME